MATKSLALLYRPKTFDDVCEQESIKTILKEQLATSTIKNAYLFCGASGCGKTTCARIFANEINKQQGNPIEIDAASNNSVENIREIIQNAQTKSLNSEYKIFIVDECMTGDTEILTSDGFKRFDALIGNEMVAQYNDDGSIEFVHPSSFIKNPYKGYLKCWSPRNWSTVRMTPNHVQPLHYVKSDKIKEKYIKDVKFNQMNELIVSGKGDGTKHELNIIDRLVIASQADGTLQYCRDNYSHWIIQLKRGRKIGRLLKLFEEGNIDYTEIKAKTGFRRFSYNMPVNATKLLSTYFSLNFDYNCAREFINEISMWDGSITPNYLYYSSTVKENSDFVSAVATLAGYSSRLRVQHDSRKDSYKSMYRVYMYDVNYVSCASIQKTMHEEYYNGYVYCVKVPSHKIIVRADGFTFITGNCHMLSNAAWNAMLKLIEEPPAKTIFIFATTDPQKIPKTILGRVQRYDFKRISQEAIENRLVHVLKEEDRLSGNNSTWDAESIEFIAKMANGQMRDALTMLDKCLSYSNYVTIENVVKALGTVNYDIMFKLTNRIFDGNAKEVIKLIGEIYMSGSDLKQFVKDYMLFILDINKYGILEAINYTNIPATQDYMEELESYGNAEFKICKHLLDTLIKLNTDIKWDSAPKGIIEATLLLECKESI